MNTKSNSVLRELKADELEKVSATGVFPILRVPVGPAIPSPSPTSGGTGDGGGGGGGSSGGIHHTN